MKLGERLSSLRKEKGISQLELAEALRVSRQAVSRWECGEALPSTEHLITLSELYGIDILSGAGNNIPPQTVSGERTEDSQTGDRFRKRVRVAAWVLCGLAVCTAICISIGFAISKAQTTGVDTTPIEELQSDVVTVDSYVELAPW